MYHFYETLVDSRTGIPVQGAEVWLFNTLGGAAPIYSDAAGSSEIVQPIITDSDGYAHAFVPDGVYTIEFRANGKVRQILAYPMFDLPDIRADLDTVITGLATHDHDARYYTKGQADAALAAGLATKSDTSHTHDTRYYTEAEIDTLLGGYALSGHNHDANYSPLLLVPTVEAGTAYATVATDKYVAKLLTNAALVTVTLNNLPPVGSRVRLTAMGAAGFTLAAGAGMTLRSRGDDIASGGQYAVAEAHRITDTEWLILGDVQ